MSPGPAISPARAMAETADSELLDRAGGCLVGVAVGDALGGVTEGLSAARIAELHGRLTEITAPGPATRAAGDTSDDTAQTLALAESIAERGELDAADAARRLVVWFEGGARGVGRHTAAVLGRMAAGEDWEQATLEAQAAAPKSAGNGSLMRCAPVAILRCRDHQRLIADSRLSSRITHPHAECQWSCALLNMVIAGLLIGEEPRAAIARANEYISAQPETVPQVPARARWAIKAGEADKPPSTGYVLDTLQASLWSLVFSDSLEDALVRAVNLGGDADTIGAVTGALAGAAYGFADIPDRWLVHIRSWWRLQELGQAIAELA